MRIALSSGSLYTYGLDRGFSLAAEAGFHGVEVLVDHRWDTFQTEYLRFLVGRHRLPIVSLHSPFSWRMDSWDRGQALKMETTIRLARALDVRVVVAHLPLRWRELEIRLSDPPRRQVLPVWPHEQDYERWLLNDVARIEAETGVLVGVENMPLSTWGRFRVNRFRLNDGRKLEEHVKRYPHLTMDTTHLGTWGADVLEFYEMAKERVANIHLSNYADGKEHRLPWDGLLPLKELLERLRRDGYAGNLVVEVNPEILGAEDPAVVRRKLEELVAFCGG